MSYVLTAPELVTTAAAQLEPIGASIGAAQAAAAESTSGVLAAGRDEVSAAIAAAFRAYGQTYRRAVEDTMAFHAEFTRTLAAAGGAYAEAESANAALLSGQTPVGSLLGEALGSIFHLIPPGPYCWRP